jgi:hypothetical protein
MCENSQFIEDSNSNPERKSPINRAILTQSIDLKSFPVVTHLRHNLRKYSYATFHILVRGSHTWIFKWDSSLQEIGFVGGAFDNGVAIQVEVSNEATNLNTDNQFEQPTDPSISSCGFFIDETQISLGNDTGTYAYPTQAVADELVERYFKSYASSLPIVGNEIFLGQCRSFYSNDTARE